MNWFRALWVNHGTKLIGATQSVFGALVTADAATRAAGGESMLTPKQLGICIFAAGLLTVWRGFVNSSNGDKP